MLVLVLALAGCGDEVAPGAGSTLSLADRQLVTAYQVKRVNLTRVKVLAARNAYAKGCSVKYTSPLLDAVHVSIYAPWDWSI